MKRYLVILTAAGVGLLLSCRGGDADRKVLETLAADTAAAEETPGYDAFSASTNHSSKEEILEPKLDFLAGAAFIRPPQINNYGTVNLSHAMEVPRGRAGMQPSLGLTYSSSGGDGLAGIGWSLSTGLGVISRSTAQGQLYYDRRDTFTFNGKRLVKTGGSAGSEDGEYRLEIEAGFSRFELSGAASGGVWRVYDKSGTVTIYGESRSCRIARPDDETGTYIWNFSRSMDLNGNYMTAAYDDSEYEDKRILYLKEIRYTGNARENAPARQWVRFTYRARDDAYVSKAPGFVMAMDRLLDEVETGWDSHSLWKYTCKYRVSDDSGRPLLEKVLSTKNTTAPEFVYGGAERYFQWQTAANPHASDPLENPEDAHYFEGDFNGDGLSDMVFFNPETGLWKAAEALPGGGYRSMLYGSRFRGYGGGRIQWFRGGVTGDYNGDGRSDIAFYLTETRELWVAQHNGVTFDFRRYGTLDTRVDIFSCEWFAGDFDGNGLSDAVLFHEATGRWIFMKNTGGAFEFISFSNHFRNLFRDDYAPDRYLNCGSTSDTSAAGGHRDRVHFQCGDYNGDGRTDISMYDARTGSWWVGENGRIDASTALGTGTSTALGTGLDFTMRWYRYGRFTAPEQSLFAHDRFSGDFNGDGFSDFLLFDRDSGEWWIGETGDRSISFRVYSRAPKYREITRWLQGDFNGDGRTDIGFYSKSGGGFWIGEASPEGFRYRLYTSLADCPDPGRVLAAPLPRDEVTLTEATAVVPGAGVTSAISYQYDGNNHRGRGELVCAGHFTAAPQPGSVPEFLIYSRAEGRFYLKKGSGDPSPVLDSAGLNADGSRLLEGGRPRPYRGNDGILYYRAENRVTGGKKHLFSLVRHDGAAFIDEPFASFDDAAVAGFDMGASLYWVDGFAGAGAARLLVLDDRRETPDFVLFTSDSAGQEGSFVRVALSGGALDAAYFRNARLRGNLKIFSGVFAGAERAGMLLVDYSGSTHRWYLGRITGGGTAQQPGATIAFTALSGNPRYYPGGFIAARAGSGADTGDFVYAAAPDGPVCFHRLLVEAGRISPVRDYILPETFEFRGDFDHQGRPVAFTAPAGASGGASAQRVVLETSGYRLENLPLEAAVKRPDLLTKVYPFRWIQGDYNGDGMTDIGFFNLRERDWYFAMTRGTVPDLVTGVKNGIGGVYDMDYVNSSGFDSTGDDGIPHLPVNYRVCSRLTVRDGLGRFVATRFEYGKGCAFSAFINGVKETDYFGFGEFTVIDAYGGKTISRYHNVPYDDFRRNRALAGAVKETRRVGADGVEYGRVEYDYRVRDVAPDSGGEAKSFLVEPAAVRTYARGVLVETRESSIDLVPGRYEVKSSTGSVTDHYEDAVHRPVKAEHRSEYETVASTNETRPALIKNFIGTEREIATRYEYDGRGNLARQVMSGTGPGRAPARDRVMEYAYDGYGNRARETDASGMPVRVVEKSYDGEFHQFITGERAMGDAVTLETKYEISFGMAFGAMAIKTDPNGRSVYFEYDGLGRLERERVDTDSGVGTVNEYSYSAEFPLSGKVTQHADTSAGLSVRPDDTIETRIYADGMGRVIHSIRSATAEQGRRYVRSGVIAYDRAGRVIRQGQPSFTDDGEIDVFAAQWKEKNPIITEYDTSGRPAKITLPPAYGGEPESSTSYEYRDPWEMVENHSAGRSRRTVKNARGLVLYVEDSGIGDDGAPAAARIGFAYDIAGGRTKKMDLPLATGLNPSLTDVPEGLFRPGMKDMTGANVAAWRYDAFGRVVESSDPDLGYQALSYNAFGDMVSKTDGLGRVTDFVYDRLGRMIEKRHPEGEGSVTYTYDRLRGSDNALGRVVRIDDTAQTKTFSYDAIGRVKEETRRIKSPLSSSPNGPVSSEETSPPDSLSYEERGRFVTRYRYDLVGRKTAIDYPEDPRTGKRITVTYTHCAMGVTSVMAGEAGAASPIVKGITYNEFGQMEELSRGNGSVSRYRYDARSRLSHLLTTARHNGATWKVQDVSYSFKTDNSIAGMENRADVAADGACASTIQYRYRYDGLNRLVHAEGSYEKEMIAPPGEAAQSGMPPASRFPGAFSPTDPLSSGVSSPPHPLSSEERGSIRKKFVLGYSYAPNGNLLSKTTYDPESGAVQDRWDYRYANHAVTGIDSSAGSARHAMTYDAAGNMVLQRDSGKGLAKEMAYDSLNRIRRVTNPDNGEILGRYDYDDQGFRVRRMSRRVIDGEERAVETVSPSQYMTLEKQKTIDGAAVKGSGRCVNHIYLNGVRVAALTPGGASLYYLTDQVDSVSLTLDGAGKIVSQYEYLPYGETWTQEGDEKHTPKYNSQELDRETGYYFYNARHYDPEIGRFVTADNVVDGEYDTQGWNRYSYVKGNPIIYKDPTGHLPDGAGILSFGIQLGEELVDTISNLLSSNGANSTSSDKGVYNKAARDSTIQNISSDTNKKGYLAGYQYWEGNKEKNSNNISLVKKNDNEYYKVYRNFTLDGQMFVGAYEPISKDDTINTIVNYGIHKIDTWCNYAASKIADAYGATRLTADKKGQFDAHTLYRKLQAGDLNTQTHIYDKVSFNRAEKYASQGGFSIVVSDGHVATLIGGYKDNQKGENNLNIFQAGASFGEMIKQDGFGNVNTDYYIWRKK